MVDVSRHLFPFFFFDVLLTVHLSIFISVFNQLDAQHFCFTISFISCLYMFRAHVLNIQEVKIALHSLWYHYTYRCDDTRGCVMQFWPPADEHMCSKHVEAWNKHIVKQKCCASSWLITEINLFPYLLAHIIPCTCSFCILLAFHFVTLLPFAIQTSRLF